jgi:hypothetical protein
VPEGIFVVALDSAATLAADELLPLECVQPVLERRSAVQRRQRAGPEPRPNDRGVLQQRFLVGVEQVQPGADQPLDGLG